MPELLIDLVDHHVAHHLQHSSKKHNRRLARKGSKMSVYDLINPMNLRRAIKSTFTGDASELVAEMLQFYFF
jgi:uncharacterized membrane protein YqgA involved in biofilm formation